MQVYIHEKNEGTKQKMASNKIGRKEKLEVRKGWDDERMKDSVIIT